MHKIYVLGIGPGSKEYILPITTKIIKDSDVLIGGERNLQNFKDSGKEIKYIGKNLKELIKYTKEHMQKKKISYLLSGDTGFYSMLKFLKKHFKNEELEVIPGISSYQYLMAKINDTWHDAYIGSLHGRSFDFIKKVKKHHKVILLTDYKYSPKEIAKLMIQSQINGKIMIVGENLSYENEKITIASPKEIIKMSDFQMSVVVIKDEMEV
ncbi:precorrin-6y C5,15-methyltransferase (decarboxylating) subunit CbiE [Crassaminicella thermophila]|uniref:Precorrin-6y C5,15-methyltransferase (Decarboxylating) subunit CbiE n=1 Tax=Crassaminicella thermophila TaxID=2599308 RepID=A0A5C0SB80_CRATE|nr:precorrin-6y C5,15-methyltransferase (decarboxylating) subunit CbiE [Crassaminicella thermophila]QEK11813.1 precorrin-6y C5,15-methyltransferase (decarboxylating) subunit CbiE [Crassaminicella thermophila]